MPIYTSSTQIKNGPFFIVNIDINQSHHRFEVNDPNARIDNQINDFMYALKNKMPHRIFLVLDDEHDVHLENGTCQPGSYLKLEYDVSYLKLTSAYDGKAYLSKFHVHSQANHDRLVKDIDQIFTKIIEVQNQVHSNCIMDICNLDARLLTNE